MYAPTTVLSQSLDLAIVCGLAGNLLLLTTQAVPIAFPDASTLTRRMIEDSAMIYSIALSADTETATIL